MANLDETSVRLLKMMAEDRSIIIDKKPTGYHTVKDGVTIGSVCSKRLNKLVKEGKIGKSNVGDVHVLISE